MPFQSLDRTAKKEGSHPDHSRILYTFHCPFNISGQNRNRMVISTLSGKPLKVYPSINNASVSLTRFFFDLYEVDFYKYKEDVFYHEFTSDTIFKINHQLELEPHYVLGLGEKLPTLTEIRNGDAISKDKNLVFGHIMETDRWLLLSNCKIPVRISYPHHHCQA